MGASALSVELLDQAEETAQSAYESGNRITHYGYTYMDVKNHYFLTIHPLCGKLLVGGFNHLEKYKSMGRIISWKIKNV